MQQTQTKINAAQNEFTVLVEQDSDGMLISTVVEIEGCHTQARTIDELLERTKEAIEVCLEAGENETASPAANTFIGLHRVTVETHSQPHT